MSINPVKRPSTQQPSQVARFDTAKANKEAVQSAALKGLLLEKHIKKQEVKEAFDNFDRISASLLIPQEIKLESKYQKKEKEEFNIKQVLKPLAITSGIALATIIGISAMMRGYSKTMANAADLVRPEDLARNINIVEEPHFAMYRALRDPSAKNVLGLIGVGLMSAVTIVGKNAVDGIKEAWIKKQECNINHDLQENLISVETEAFSGKLNVVNTLLSDTTKYFKSVLTNDSKTAKNYSFQSFLSFKGNEEKETNETDKSNKIKTILAIAGGIVGLVGIGYGIFKNYQKTIGNLEKFSQKYQDCEIKSRIEKAVSQSDKSKALKELLNVLKSTNVKGAAAETEVRKIAGITDEEIKKFLNELEDSLIYSNADKAMYGTAGKIQYYCYINEERGHLYNWILNPENKFNKYLFLSFSAITATGYVTRAVVDAIKNVAVSKENSKSELEMRKKLVSTEINNFKAKKMSAINPMLDNFMYQVDHGKSKEELKELAENILIEIKNGPPYVYS